MLLNEGKIGDSYQVQEIKLSTNMEKRLEALGMIRGTSAAVLNSKGDGVLINDLNIRRVDLPGTCILFRPRLAYWLTGRMRYRRRTIAHMSFACIIAVERGGVG